MRLGSEPDVPELLHIVDRRGDINVEMAEKAHAWLKPAFELARLTTQAGESLAVPTWHYGHEPSSPFATKIAKYFQNSIREDGLLAIAGQGIVLQG